ncbi:hypothetical protein [Streptomyces sp. NBC_00063]|uniref:hypothetical protein n=1 Tax=Streptomyces sp. NBC_00063 TaxID=2975638 RepID=UPI003D7221D8
MVDQLAQFTEEVTRVAPEVDTKGRLAGRALVRDAWPGVGGTRPSRSTRRASRPTVRVRNITPVTTAVTRGESDTYGHDRRARRTARTELTELTELTMNTMADQATRELSREMRRGRTP